nr:Krueppel-like factor 17 isoform X2 [Oryctolagus cuniculus]
MHMLDIFPSSGSSGVNEPCSYGLPSTQHFTQGTDMLGAPLLPAEAPMLGEGGVGSQFGMNLQEHGMSYSSQATLPSPQMIYNQGVLPPQPGMMMPQMMPLEPRIPEPTPAAQGVDNSWAQEREPSRRSPVSRPYICQYENCGKAYTKRSHLVSHERKHTGDRLYKCQWEGCNWSFFRSDELTRHSRIHTRYRPHRCEQCGRQFMRSDHLRQHQRIHQRMPGSPDPQADGEQMDNILLPGL